MAVSHVARGLGVHPETFRRWMRELALPATVTLPATPSTGELVRLQRENEQLRMERDMLKKARGICSRMPQ